VKKVSRLTGLLLVLALGIMALGATLTHADPNAIWKINGTNNTSTLKPQVQVTELETLAATGVKEGILLTKVGATKIEILCTEMKLVDALLGLTGSAIGKFHFSGCVTKLNGIVNIACKPHSPGAASGLIETNALTGLIVLHSLKNEKGEEIGKDELIQISPPASGKFVTIIMGPEVESECPEGTKFDVTGSAFVKAGTTTELKTETVEKLFSEGPLTALLFGGNAATIDGSAKTALVASHLGMKWSGIAG